MSAKPALEPTLRALVARDRRSLDQHPTPEVLVAYHAGELRGNEEETLRDHLALCPDCAELLLDLVSFAEFVPPEETATLADSEVESAWHKVQPQIAGPKTPVVRPIQERHRETASRDLVPRRRLTQAYAMAATLFFGVVGLSVWGFSLKNQIAEQLKPRPNPVVADAFSTKDGVRSVSPEEVSAPGKERFSLFLHPDTSLDLAQFREFSAEIRTSGALVAKVDGMVRLKDGTLSLDLPGKLVPPDSYQVDLYGVSGGQQKKIDTFVFRVASP